MKAWENAYAWSNDRVLQGDVITYDSYKDLIYAYGENGRKVIFAEQYALGQPTSPGASATIGSSRFPTNVSPGPWFAKMRNFASAYSSIE